MYIAYPEYTQLYNEMDEKLFNRLASDAFRVMDIHTSGIDNVKKLRSFFPVNEDDVTAVKHCAAKLINTMSIIYQAETASGYDATGNGVQGRVISSVTSGNETISYANGAASVIDAAVKDINVRSKLYGNIVSDYLRGVTDSNGVSLLYKGRYPRRYLC